MLACFPSLASTPPRSPAIGVTISCQCLPPSVVRSSVPAAPAIQQIFFAGAEPLVRVPVTGTSCDFQVLPLSLECAIAPCSPNLQILFPLDATIPDGSSARSITFLDITGRLASFFLGADVTSTVSVAAWGAAVAVICLDADCGAAGRGRGGGARSAPAPA